MELNNCTKSNVLVRSVLVIAEEGKIRGERPLAVRSHLEKRALESAALAEVRHGITY